MPWRGTFRTERIIGPHQRHSKGGSVFMVKPQYLLFAVLTLVIFLVILGLFVFGPDSSPFDSGATKSLVGR
jgi:hypothetical protein